MSAQYPEEFPYAAQSCSPLTVWRKKCLLCGSDVEWPKRWQIWINGVPRFTMYGQPQETLILCSATCACRYFWKDYCLRRLKGKL